MRSGAARVGFSAIGGLLFVGLLWAVWPSGSSVLPPSTADLVVDLGGGETMAFVRVEPGVVEVEPTLLHHGSSLEIDAPYLIGVHEVTVGQWNAVLPDAAVDDSGASLPVARRTYEHCTSFVAALNELVQPDYVASLPTEVEWEYACRAGDGRDLMHGREPERFDAAVWHRDNCGATQARPLGVRGPRGWYGISLQPVGTKLPNELGIHDMVGNISEWCIVDVTWESSGLLASESGAPRNPGGGVLRGGSVGRGPREISARSRGFKTPGLPPGNTGLRVVLIPASGEPLDAE